MKARQTLLTLALCGVASLAGAQPAGVQPRSAVSDAPPRNNISAPMTPESVGGSGVSSGGGPSATGRRVVAVPGGDPSYGGDPGYGGGEYYPAPAPFYPIQPEIWTAKDAYAVGEPIEFFFSCNRDAYVYIFNTDAAGITSQIFPNYWDQANYIRGGRAYKIPTYSPDNYHFRIAEPAGGESVTIVATADVYQPCTVYHSSFTVQDPYPTRIPSPSSFIAQLDISWRGSFGGGHRGGHDEMSVGASFSSNDGDSHFDGGFSYAGGRRSGDSQVEAGVSFGGGAQGRRVVAVPGGDPNYAPPPPPIVAGPSYEFGAATLHFTTYRAGFPHPYPQPGIVVPVPVPPSPPYHRPNPPSQPHWRDRPTPPWRR